MRTTPHRDGSEMTTAFGRGTGPLSLRDSRGRLRFVSKVSPRRISVGLFAALLLLGQIPARAQDSPSYAEQPVIVEYEVDADWPRRPEDVSARGWVSGLAIDKH